MERHQLDSSNIAIHCLSFISKARIVVLAGGLVKKLASMFLMLVFTVFAFVVLVVSVVVLTGQSLVGAVFSPANALKKESWQDFLKGEAFFSNQLSQTK